MIQRAVIHMAIERKIILSGARILVEVIGRVCGSALVQGFFSPLCSEIDF